MYCNSIKEKSIIIIDKTILSLIKILFIILTYLIHNNLHFCVLTIINKHNSIFVFIY